MNLEMFLASWTRCLALHRQWVQSEVVQHQMLLTFRIPNRREDISSLWWRTNINGNRSFRQRVSSPTTSSLVLKSIRQRIMSVCRYASECNEQHLYARNQTNIIQTQWFFKLRECSIIKEKAVHILQMKAVLHTKFSNTISYRSV